MFSIYLKPCLNLNLKCIASYTTLAVPFKFSIPALFQKKEKMPELSYEPIKGSDIDMTLEFIKSNFYPEDPLCRSLKIGSSKNKSEVLICDMLKESLAQGMSLMAYDADSKEIVGTCINNRNCPWDSQRLEEYAKVAQDSNTKRLFFIWALLNREANLHQELDVKSIFEVNFLTVKPQLYNRGIGMELARRSLSLGRDLNFSHARMDCTSDYSMKIAEKLGMKKLWDVPYKNILMQDGKTPLTLPEYPHTHGAVYYVSLKDDQ